MPRYLVFGGCLDAPLDFPQLPIAPQGSAANWEIAKISSRDDLKNPKLLGENQISSKATVRLYQHKEGFRLHYNDSGTFDISADGAKILWAPEFGAEEANVREDILGPVLAMAMHVCGRMCLHGSSVVLRGGAVAFLAPKHHGKSTLAMAALARGATLLTDDSLPVEPGPPAMAWPGVASVRFWDDTRAHFYAEGRTIEGAGGKHAAIDLAEKSQLTKCQPLSAIYLLAPIQATSGSQPLQREKVAGIESALALVRHAKIGHLLGKSQGGVMLDRASAIAREVPVYVLRIERSIARLDAVVDQIFSWHGQGERAP